MCVCFSPAALVPVSLTGWCFSALVLSSDHCPPLSGHKMAAFPCVCESSITPSCFETEQDVELPDVHERKTQKGSERLCEYIKIIIKMKNNFKTKFTLRSSICFSVVAPSLGLPFGSSSLGGLKELSFVAIRSNKVDKRM